MDTQTLLHKYVHVRILCIGVCIKPVVTVAPPDADSYVVSCSSVPVLNQPPYYTIHNWLEQFKPMVQLEVGIASHA